MQLFVDNLLDFEKNFKTEQFDTIKTEYLMDLYNKLVKNSKLRGLVNIT